MMPAHAGRRREPEEPEGRYACAQCDARVRAAEIIRDGHIRIADSMDAAVRELRPLVQATTELSFRANALCRFLRKWTLPLLIGMVLSGAITPDMAHGFHNLLAAIGIQR